MKNAKEVKRKYRPRRKVWKLNDEHLVRHFSAAVQQLASNKQCDDSVESTWATLRDSLLEATEMVKALGDTGIELITSLANQIMKDGVIPQDWQSSVIVNCFKGKGDALERGNYRGLKLVDQVMKVIERVIDRLLRERIDIDEMQFGFVPGRGTTDAIFLFRQLRKKYLGKRNNLYLAFVDLEKAFDRVPRRVVWWAMRKLGVDEWLVKIVQSMYTNARSRVRVNDSLSEEFSVKVGVHQGSVLSPLLFIMVLEASSIQFRTGCP